MQMVSNILAMTGHEPYIWAAYATATAILMGLLIIFRRQLHNAYTKISMLEAKSQQRQHDRADGEGGIT